MPFAFAPTEPMQTGSVSKWDIPFNDWLGIKFGVGQADTFGGAVSRFVEDQIYDNGPAMTPEVADRVFGIPGYLKFKEPVTIGRARLLNERKQAELYRMSDLESASHSAFSFKAAAGFLAQMAGGLSHPLDFGTMFMPMVGTEKAVADMAHIGGGVLRQGMARGLVTKEGLATAGLPRISAPLIDGTLSQAVVEIPVAVQKFRDKAEYTVGDAVFNIAAGGAFAGAIHAGGALLAHGLERAGIIVRSLEQSTKDNILNAAINDAINTGEIDAAKFVAVDANAIRAKLTAEFREEIRQKVEERFGGELDRAGKISATILEAANAKGASAVDLLDLARSAANVGGGKGKAAARLLERFRGGEATVPLFRQIGDLFDLRYDPLAPTVQENFKVENIFGPQQRLQDSAAKAFKDARIKRHYIEYALKEAYHQLRGATDPAEVRVISSKASRLEQSLRDLDSEIGQAKTLLKDQRGPLTAEELAAHADEVGPEKERLAADLQAEQQRAAFREEQVRNRMQAAIQDLMAQEMDSLKARLEDRIPKETQIEIERQIAEGKTLSDEQIKQYSTKDVPEESDISSVKADAAEQERGLLSKAEDEQAKKSLETALEKEKESAYPSSRADSVKAAIDCAIKLLLK